MATITFSRSFSFQDEPLWTGALSQTSSTSFIISDPTHTLTFTGTFTYPAGAPTGIVQSIVLESSGIVYAIAAINKQVASVAQAALNGGFTEATYAFLLSGNDTLIGSAEADTLQGFAGNDTYVIGEGDSVVEAENGGIDLVRSSVDYRLEDNLENLTLIGAGDIDGKGNNLNNVITGNDGDNKLDGVGGIDTLIGGLGDDQYVVDLTTSNQLEDRIVELAGQGNDTLTLFSEFVNNTVTTLVLAAALENIDARDTGTLRLNLTGNAADNLMQGNAGDNTLNGLAGADTLIGQDGNDTYVVDNAGDTVVEHTNEGIDTVNVAIATPGGQFTLDDNIENARLTNTVAFDLTGNKLDNQLIGNAAANRIDGGEGADDMQGGGGNDTYVVDNIGDQVTDTAGVDTVESSISYTLGAGLENLVLTGTDPISGTGNALANQLDGAQNSAANVLTGLAGNDTYIVDAGDTVVEAADGGIDTVRTAFNYTLGDNLENLTLTGTDNIDGTGNGLANIIIGNSGNNALNGGDGVDTLQGGAGNDDYDVELGQNNLIVDRIVEAANQGIDFVNLRGGNSTLATAVTITLGANLEALDASAAAGVKLNLTGNAEDNLLFGNDTDNLINGAAGADLMIGGAGNDTYVVDNLNDDVIEVADEGDDTVNVAIGVAGGLYALGDNIERARLTNSVAFDLTGNDLDNQLIGNGAANRIDGGLGADDMQGGAGNDTYVVDDAGDQVTDTAGIDTVEASITYTLATGLENLTLTGSAAIDGTGNAAANVLDGSQNTAANVLTGLAGNDTYIVSDGDTVVEAAGGGTDTVRSDASFTLGDNVENLTLIGSADIDGTGNGLANVIIGNSGNNVLDGQGGVDTLQGGAGADTYLLDLSQANTIIDRVVEGANAGFDTLVLRGGNSALTSAVTIALAANLEALDASGATGVRLNLTGNAAGNVLIGNDTDNLINGGAGADVMAGLAGNDTYTVDSFSDQVQENSAEGNDTVNIAIASAGALYTLGDNIENGRLTNTVAFDLSGNAADNRLIGNGAANRLDGGLGADDMQGGGGNDTYVVDNAGDLVSDSAGIDTVESSLTYTLGAGLENLVLTGSAAINGTGNAVANTLDGSRNSAANVLTGLAGNDLYILGAGDTVVEAAGGGTDSVQTAFDHVLADNVENLTLTGTDDVDGTGNGLANVIVGNSGDNVLMGLGGVDTLRGGAGNDTYVVDLTATSTLQDTVTELANQGIDTLRLTGGNSAAALATIALAATLENLDASLTGSVRLNLTGNAADNLITGNDADNVINGGVGNDTLFGGLGNDTLIGGTGNDQMFGGGGNDTYTVDSVGDSVVEGSDEGIDQVNVGIATAGGTFILASNVENATLTNTVAYNLTGNELDNTLVGNAAANELDGGAGADVMRGGAGNDIYHVDDVGDAIVDTSGIDTVISSITFSLDGSNLENLTLIGSDDLDAIGNELANHLIGNSGNNILDGLGGVDILEGGAGDDVYFVDLTASNAVQDSVIEQAGQGQDALVLFGGTAGLPAVTLTLGANLETLDVSLTEEGVNLNLLGNALDNLLIGNTSQNVFTGGLGSDTFAFDVLAQVDNNGAGSDTITDFVTGVDKLDLTGIGNFTLVDAAAGLNGNANQVWLDQGVLHGTLDGANEAFEIVLTGVNNLSQSDFVA